ncbi:YdeI/OmpD-associated family protein [Acidothermaceae bacterium B102]|nr:YdeI/OmpD-associated family protein [Acidothermaceae bacterium B102]
MGPQFFATSDELRAWFIAHHDTADELIVAMWKVGTGRPSVTWSEAVDQALCFGWIDGVRRRIDDHAFSNRFTPRRPRSNWSDINLAKVEALIAADLMQPAGLAAYENRVVRAAAYSFEQSGELALDLLQEGQFRAKAEAWVFWQSRSAAYRKRALWWVLSAKRGETRASRLAALIQLCQDHKTM